MALDLTILTFLTLIFGGFAYRMMTSRQRVLPWRILFYVFAALLAAVFYAIGGVLSLAFSSAALSAEGIAKVLANALIWGLISPIVGRWLLNKFFRNARKDGIPSDAKQKN